MRFFYASLLGLLWIYPTVDSMAIDRRVALVPQPINTSLSTGRLELDDEIRVSQINDPSWKRHLEIVGSHIQRMSKGKHRFKVTIDERPDLLVRKNDGLSPEQYSLKVNGERIELEATSLKGLAHGTATLLQLIGQSTDRSLPNVEITDAPQVPYRNFMVDMGRNPHSLELLKETIDLLWFYKVDSLQLHLADDQRFAFPSTAFPDLWDGNITLQEFRELEEYAVLRGVTIIPELEVPGHSGQLREKYPEVFGKEPTELASSVRALSGIKTLLDEMMDVFSSTPYIHIGGDEAFGVPEELQRDLINTLNDYLETKGRQTIVWEGPAPGKGENKVNTDVIHINWRTINYPAGDMLKDGYRVVNAAWDPLYIVDHYPRTNFTMTSPEHIYRTLNLTRFKHVNPGIRTYAQPDEVEPSDRLIGFCMPWWEGREENYFSQNVPRLIPFSEVSWNPSLERDFGSFEKRCSTTEAVRLAAFYPVTIEPDKLVVESDGVFHEQLHIRLIADSEKEATDSNIRYTLDGSTPTASSAAYSRPISIDTTTTVRAALFRAGEQVGHGSRRNFTAVSPVVNLALGKPVTSTVSSGSPFSVERLTDGGTGDLDFYLGYPTEPTPLQVTIDLEEVYQVDRIDVHAYTNSGSFEKYTVEASRDGKSFEEVAARLNKPSKATQVESHSFPSRDARFIRITSFGNKGYVFDSFSKLIEIQVFAAETEAVTRQSRQARPE